MGAHPRKRYTLPFRTFVHVLIAPLPPYLTQLLNTFVDLELRPLLVNATNSVQNEASYETNHKHQQGFPPLVLFFATIVLLFTMESQD